MAIGRRKVLAAGGTIALVAAAWALTNTDGTGPSAGPGRATTTTISADQALYEDLLPDTLTDAPAARATTPLRSTVADPVRLPAPDTEPVVESMTVPDAVNAPVPVARTDVVVSTTTPAADNAPDPVVADAVA